MNLVEYLGKASGYLEEHAVESPRLNAELLLSHLMALSRVELYTNFDRSLTDEQAARYREMLQRRASGCPVQYITGEAGFHGSLFAMREAVFVPRPETEVLVQAALEVLADGPCAVLDLGTGCGNIAVTVALERPAARVTATDIDDAALALARENAVRHGVAERVELKQGDLYAALPQDAGGFAAILSNPPYIPDGAMAGLPREVKDFEPQRALCGGADGLAVVREILAGAGSRLAPGGWLLLELDESHAQSLRAAVEADPAWEAVALFDDLAGRPRVLRARKAGEDGGR